MFALLLALASAAAQECRFTPITPFQPALRVEENERALESQTFQTNAFALSPENAPHFVDTVNRIRRLDPDGRLRTLAGNGTRADSLAPGPALTSPMPAASQILFDGRGVLHFTALGRVFRIVNDNIEAVAGSGKPGFNLESGPALVVNLGAIVNAAFGPRGELYLIDGFNRVRMLEGGLLRTVAGSIRPAAAAGLTGDNGPAGQASLSNPRQVIPFRDGSLWIKDLGGRHLRLVDADRIIRTVNTNFETSGSILTMPDGTPVLATANRVYPVRPTGIIETGAAPFAPFTGTPLAVSADNALYFLGSERPEQRNPLVRLKDRTQTVLAGAPVAATVDGQAPPFGVWLPRTGSFLYATAAVGKTGILESRPGQSPRFVVGGGADINDPDGKQATDVSIFGIPSFTIDGEGRIILADTSRRRILIVGPDGKVSVLKQGGDPYVYAPLGSFGAALQRLAADNAGNVYWYEQGGTPTGGVFTAEVAVWNRASSSISRVTVPGLGGLMRLEDGTVVALAGNSAGFRSAYRMEGARLGPVLDPWRLLPLTSVARWRDTPYFTSGNRLFRVAAGRIEMLDLAYLPSGAAFNPNFAASTPSNLLVRLGDSGFYSIDGIEACQWLPQPVIGERGLVNAASFDQPNLVSARQLVTLSGTGFGPPEGQAMVLDGTLRASLPPAPFPTLFLGGFTGAIPLAALAGTALPVVYADASHATLQVPALANGRYLLFFTWQGLAIFHPNQVEVAAVSPGMFAEGGFAAALNEDGSRHSASNPALAGSVLRLFGTGFGAVSPAVAGGEPFDPAITYQAANAITAAVGGAGATVEFAGGAPATLGVFVIDVRLPEDFEAGIYELTLGVAGKTTSPVRVAISRSPLSLTPPISTSNN